MQLFGAILLLIFVSSCSQTPIPAEQEPETTPVSSTTEDYSPPSLSVIGEDDDDHSSPSDNPDNSVDEDNHDKQKRHRPTPSPEEIEERRKALIKALGGGGGEDGEEPSGGGGLAASIQGLGSLATDVVSLLTSNANETYGPLRESLKKARNNFPDLGTRVNRYLKNGSEYARRAYRSLLKNARVKLTNTLRFLLSVMTRLATTLGGLYQVAVSLLDVTTRSITNGARVGSRLLQVGSNATAAILARGTGVLRTFTNNGNFLKPVNQAVQVSQGFAKGLGEDLFDQVEWAQEGINTKLELVQALAPNFLLHAHENASPSPPISDDDSSSSGGSDDPAGYSSLTNNDDDMVLLSLASTAAELMQRGGRNANMNDSSTPSAKSSSSTNPNSTDKAFPDGGPPQALLNDIFGLQEEIKEIKKNGTTSATTETSSTTTVKIR